MPLKRTMERDSKFDKENCATHDSLNSSPARKPRAFDVVRAALSLPAGCIVAAFALRSRFHAADIHGDCIAARNVRQSVMGT
jgi:hypothetical protein